MQPAGIDEARRIFGADVLGREEISAALRADFSRSAVAPPPFAPDVLMRAADEGMMLVLRVPRTADGAPLAILELGARLSTRTDHGPDGPRFAREPFPAETWPLGWALVEETAF